MLSALRQENVKGCIVGGLAVSARCDPRFTRDVDIAVATQVEWNLASEAVAQIQERGFARGRQLDSELHTLRNPII